MSGAKRPAPKEAAELAPSNIYEWDPARVAEFLTSLSLDRWKPLFEEVDGATLTELSDADLKEIGCTELLPRKKLLGHIAKLKITASEDFEILDTSCDPAALQDLKPTADVAEASASEKPPEEPASPALADDTLPSLAEEREKLGRLREEMQGDLQKLCDCVQVEAERLKALPAAASGLAADLAQECLQELQAAHMAAEAKPIHVPLFGNTGAGKSTLLNAVLCQETVPTSGWRSCTAVPVELVPEPLSRIFTGEVHLKSIADWASEVESLLGDLLMSDRVRVSRREPVRGGDPTPAAIAYDTLFAVYPEAFEDTRPWTDIRTARSTLDRTKNRVTRQHRQSQVLKFSNACSLNLTAEILDYVDSPDGENVAAFWPLVKKVRICGPFECHPRVVLVDAPGVQDANSARASVVKQLLEEASGVVIVSAIKRAATEKVAQEMLGERFRRQMLMDGHYAGNLAFVATCTDDLTLSELRKNLKIGDDVPQKEAAVLRNEKTKERILADTFAGIRRIQAQSDSKRSSNEELQARGIFPAVFTTSARDYQKLRGLLDTKVDGRARIWSTVEDTEIPAFRLWLHAQGRKADLAALESAQQRTQTVLQKLQESSTGEIVEQGLVQRWAEDARHTIQAVMDEVIRGCMKKAKTEMQESLMQQLKVGQQEATEAAGQSFEKRCQPMGRGGLHWCTFKATCRREGEWRESFNELLADPLNRAIAVKWDQTLNSFLPQCVQDALDTLCSELSELQKKHLLPGQAFKEAAEWLQGQGPGIKASMQKRQMELSRQIKETIQGLMRPSYKQAAGMSGGGTDVRQKQVIYTQVKERGGSMFQRACAFLQEELSQLLASLEKNLAASVATAIARLEQSMIRLSAQGKEMEALRCLRGAVAEAIAELEKKAEGRKESLQVLKDLVTAKVARALPTPPTEISTRIDAIPNEFICPISQQVMEDPVQTADGYSYERSHIAEWLSRNSISPMTGKQLENKVVVPNHSLRKLITDSGHGPKISTSSGPAAEVSADEDMDEQELFSVPMEEEESADRFEVFPEVSSLAAPSDLGADLGMAEDDEPRSPEESVENQSFVDDTRVAAGDSDLDLDQLLESVMNEANLDNDSAGNYNGRLDNEEELEEPILGEGLLPDGDEELFQSADEAVAAAA